MKGDHLICVHKLIKNVIFKDIWGSLEKKQMDYLKRILLSRNKIKWNLKWL